MVVSQEGNWRLSCQTYHDGSNLRVGFEERLLQHLDSLMVSNQLALRAGSQRPGGGALGRGTNLLVGSRQGILGVGGRHCDGSRG